MVEKESALAYLEILIEDCIGAMSDDPWDFNDVGNWEAMIESIEKVKSYIEGH